MKQILVIACGTLEAGGAERIISILSAFFVQKFDQVRIYTWRDAPVFYNLDKQITVVSIPGRSGKKSLLGQMSWFRKHIKQLQPFCVLSFLAPFNMLTIVSLFGSHVPVYVAERIDPYYGCPNVFWRYLRDYIYKFSHGVCAQTQRNKDYFKGIVRQKTEVIYNPVFLKQNLIGTALKTPKEKKIVSVGRLHPQKNFELLLDAFADVDKVFPGYSLVIYGEGEIRERLECKIKQLHLTGKVTLPGNKNNIHSLLLSAEIFVMSSDYEGMSNALIEALCLGLPCISTRVSGAEELIENEKSGMLVETGDKDGLSHAIVELLKDKGKRERMAQEGIKLADRLKPEVIVEQWLQFIKKV